MFSDKIILDVYINNTTGKKYTMEMYILHGSTLFIHFGFNTKLTYVFNFYCCRNNEVNYAIRLNQAE